MPEIDTSIITPSATPGDGTPVSPPVATPAEPQTPVPATPLTPGTPPMISEAEATAMVTKARADEKSKAYQKVGQLEKEVADGKKQHAKLGKDLKDANTNLDDLRAGKSTETASLTKEMQDMRVTNEALAATVENVATEATKRIRASEVNAYKERVVRESKIELVEMVVGNTEEEVDASLLTVKAREQALRDKFAGEAAVVPDPNLPVTPPVDPPAIPPVTPVKPNLPTPISPDASYGRGPNSVLTSTDRVVIAKLPDDKYKKHRADLLATAKRKSGLI